MDWYRYLFPEQLRKYVDEVRADERVISYKDINKLSSVNTVTDLSDLAFSLKQSSKLKAADIARRAARNVIEENGLAPLRRYGLANTLVDLVNQAELVKKHCVRKALEDYENFSTSTLVQKDMFRYDCFCSQIHESSAFADVARGLGEEDVSLVMDAIDRGK